MGQIFTVCVWGGGGRGGVGEETVEGSEPTIFSSIIGHNYIAMGLRHISEY